MRIVVFSGGSACNALLDCFLTLAKEDQITFVLPVSDNGGSSSELQRVVGGIAVGDFRNRCLHLFRNEPLRKFLQCRLARDREKAKLEWSQLLSGEHVNWKEIESEHDVWMLNKSLKRLDKHINIACSKLHTEFDFSCASVGNLFLKGLEVQYGSMEIALREFIRMGRCPENVRVVPCVETEESVILCVRLADGTVIRGQSEISHPSGSESQLHFCKDDRHEALTAAIREVWYEDSDGHRIQFCAPNVTVEAIAKADLIVYGVGSLITSILPSLIVRNIATAIGQNVVAVKTVIVNGSYDRESSGLTCSQYVELIEDTLKRNSEFSRGNDVIFVSDMIRLEGGEIVEDGRLEKRVRDHVVAGTHEYKCWLLYEALIGICKKE